MKYRAEIDGLRALAVIPVILFHGGFEFVSGGFVGVDIFFTISGYLITSIILEEKDKGVFRLSAFYDRRMRRILPALLFMVMICSVFSWFFLVPEEMKNFSQSLVGVATFSSNFLFWLESGYFDNSSDLKPLLHTWSLAVEEQFYIFFPALLLLVWTLGRFFLSIIIFVLLCLSFYLAINTVYEWPDAAFYLPHTRIWELLLGALCGVFLTHRSLSYSYINQLGSSLGLVLILISVLTFDQNTTTPGWTTLLPTIGTGLIILFGTNRTWVAQLLGTRPLVWLGLISYSAYLWHQPIFAFARLTSVHEISKFSFSILILLILVLSFFSWKFIEQPFRNNKLVKRLSKAKINIIMILCSALIFIFGLLGHFTEGYPYRLSHKALELANYTFDRSSTSGHCLIRNASELPISHPVTDCLNSVNSSAIEVLLVGDSHSDSISQQVHALFREKGISSYGISFAGCVGLRGFHRIDVSSEVGCNEFNESVIEFAHRAGIKTLIISSRFPLYYEGEWFDNQNGGVESKDRAPRIDYGSSQGRLKEGSNAERKTRVLEGYKAELLKLTKEFNVVLVLPIPEVGWHVPKLMARAVMMGLFEQVDYSTSYEVYLERSLDIRNIMNSIESDNYQLVDPSELFCPDKIRCYFEDNGRPLYRDDDHLANSTGAFMLAPDIVKKAINLSEKTKKMALQ